MNITTTKIVAGVSALSLIVGVGFANAHGFRTKDNSEAFGQTRQSIMEAVESGDYQAWSGAVGNMPISDMINEENFDILTKMHNLKKQGDYEEARELAQEMGMPMMMMRKSEHRGNGRGWRVLKRIMNNDEAHRAIVNEDYESFVSAFGPDSEIEEKITEHRFNKLVKMHNRIHPNERDDSI